jgi:adenylyl- and sulfurtransferase ThiI
MNKLLAINGSMKIQLEAPLLGMDKPTIKLLAQKFGITNEEVFSGYGQ